MANNRTNDEGRVLRGPAREGLALLQGLMLCCQLRARADRSISRQRRHLSHLRVQLAAPCAPGHQELHRRARRPAGMPRSAKRCSRPLKPAELRLAVAALDDLEQRDEALMRQWNMRIERAGPMNALWPNVATKRSILPTGWWPPASSGGGTKRWSNLDVLKAEAAKYQRQTARVVRRRTEGRRSWTLARDLPRLCGGPRATQSKYRKRRWGC